MRIRMLLTAASVLAVAVALAPSSFAQGRGGRATTGTVKSVDAGAKTFVVTTRRMNQEADVTIKTDDQSRFLKGGNAGTFADVKAGGFAVVFGMGMPDTGITARQVVLLEKPGGATTGTIKSADPAAKTLTLTVGRMGMEREVTIKASDKTKIMSGMDAGKWEDLTAGKRVMVIGEGNPRQGDFTAVVIRLVPAPGANQ